MIDAITPALSAYMRECDEQAAYEAALDQAARDIFEALDECRPIVCGSYTLDWTSYSQWLGEMDERGNARLLMVFSERHAEDRLAYVRGE